MENTAATALIDLIVAGMLLAFVLATSIILFVFFYQRKVAAQRNHLQTLKIEHQTALIHATIRAVELERQQFATNLHDEVGAHLSIAKMTLSHVPAIGDLAEKQVQSTLDILDEVVDSVQNISHNLFPPVLIKLGLEKAMESYLKKIPDAHLSISFHSDGSQKRFDSDVELHAFRIFQEGVSNALKHANGSQLHVVLTYTAALFTLEISDNGTGFLEKQRIGLGLLNMESRAEMIGFEVNVNNASTGVSIYLVPKNKTV